MNKILQVVFVCLVLFSAPSFAQVSPEYETGHHHDLQNISAREIHTLNGMWSIIIDPLENGYYNPRMQPREKGFFEDKKMVNPSSLVEYNFDTDQQLMVPGDWNTQKEKLYYYEGTIWYKRTFDLLIDPSWEYEIHFGAINYEAKIYLNGFKVGEHIGGYTSFTVPVTEYVKEKDNVLILKVDNKRKLDAIPTVNTDWWNYGGITRSTSIVKLPKKHVRDYFLNINPLDNETITGWVKIRNGVKGDSLMISIPELGIEEKLAIVSEETIDFTFKAKPILWSPETPKLYEVLFTFDGYELRDHIGFRTIETSGPQILLNGEPIFLKGISIHEEAPFKTGRVTSAEEGKILLQWAKELGCNYVRLAHYPHNEEMVRQAEQMGLMVWSEIPVYWSVQFQNESTYSNAKHQLEEMISRDKNRASIVLWSVANETPQSADRLDFLSRLVIRAKSLDNTRLITAALDPDGTSIHSEGNYIDDPLGEFIDVIGVNYYCGWYGEIKPDNCKNVTWGSAYNKPLIISEFGGGALQGLHGSSNERWTEEYQVAVYENNIEMLKKIDFLAGTSPWILMDFRSHRRHLTRVQADFNRKGLISEQGQKKKAYYVLKEFYESF